MARDPNDDPAPALRHGPLRSALTKYKKCNFCRRWMGSRTFVIGGKSDHWICRRCSAKALRNVGSAPGGEARECSFCGKARNATELHISGPVPICSECLRAIAHAYRNPVLPGPR